MNMRLLTLEERKKMSLDILINFDSICKRHCIPYYLAYGTLLGAARHHGFIPWDDDIDIWVFAKDFKLLMDLLEKESAFSLINPLDSAAWPRPFSKLGYDNTIVVDKRSDSLPIKRGLAIDIFPLSYFDNHESKLKKANYIMSCTKGSFMKSKGVRGKSKQDFLFKLRSGAHDVYYWQNKFLQLEIAEPDGTFVGYIGSPYGERDKHPRDAFQTTTMIEFENMVFPAPIQYYEILRRIYGDDFMDIPPAEKQRSRHDVEVYLT